MRIQLTNMHVGNLPQLQERLQTLGPAGYTIILLLKNGGAPPTLTTFPEKWINIYEEHNLYFIDPVIMWALSDSGVMRWSDLPTLDKVASSYVMTRGSDFGFKFGAVSAVKAKGAGVAKVVISVARNDRELDDDEIKSLHILAKALRSTVRAPSLAPLDAQILQMLCDGATQAEVAANVRISPSTLKIRIASIRKELGAKNLTQSIGIAVAQGLIVAKVGQDYPKG